jgi:hypothetical protein
MELAWDDAAAGTNQGAATRGRAAVTVVDDFAAVVAAVERMVSASAASASDLFANAAFRRATLLPALFGELRMRPLTWCCVNDAGMPPPVMDGQPGSAAYKSQPDVKAVALQPFYRYCATCHQSNERTPPNFLQGSTNAVAANIAHCAERLYVRLSMWQVAPEQRVKTPMPPQYALYGFHSSPQAWRDSAELSALKTYVERTLQAQSGKTPRPDELLARGYENLRACLPEAS